MFQASPLTRDFPRQQCGSDAPKLNLTFGHVQLKPTSAKNAESHLAFSHRPPLPPQKADAPMDFGTEVLFKGNLEDYSVGRQVGQGAYAVVKLGLHKPTNTKVAIKTYEKSKLVDPRRRRNICREIEILQQLSHPNCVKLREAINSPNNIHIIMEYVGGSSLRSYLKRKPQRKLDEPQAKRLFLQIATGLQYCHSLHVCHRDIKLENIIIDESDTAKLIDFGFAVRSQQRVKAFCGTPSYMAPEIVDRKEHYSAPADVWALGVMLFALLTGTFPFKGLSDKDLYRCISRGTYDVPESVPASAKLLLARMLQVDPQNRPTCSEILTHPWLVSTGSSSTSAIEPSAYDPEVVKVLVRTTQVDMGYAHSEILSDLQRPSSLIATLYRQFKLQIKHLGRRAVSPRYGSTQSRSSSRAHSDKEN